MDMIVAIKTIFFLLGCLFTGYFRMGEQEEKGCSWVETTKSWAPTVAGVAGTAAVGAVLAPAVATKAVGLVGFKAAGVAAGTMAAGWQASIGNVAAGSLFSSLQSVGAGAGVGVAVKAVGGALGAGTYLLGSKG